MAEKKKNPNGRPPKYKPEYCKSIIKYFKSCKEYPTLAGYAVTLDVSKQTVVTWKNNYPEFLDAYTRAKSIQESKTVSGSMLGHYNPKIAEFILMNNFGGDYVKKKETDHTGTITNVNINTEEDSDIAKRFLERNK